MSLPSCCSASSPLSVLDSLWRQLARLALVCMLSGGAVSLTGSLHAGTFSVMQWTNDATSGITPGQTIWAYRFGTSTPVTVNGVTLPGVAGANPQVPGVVFIAGAFDVFNGSNPGAGLQNDFVFGGGPAADLVVYNLTVGKTYTVTCLSFSWSPPAARNVTLSSGSDSRVVNQEVFGPGGRIRVDYTFTATQNLRVIRFMPVVAGTTWHHHAVALREETGTVPQAVVLNTDGEALTAPLIESIYSRLGSSVFIEEVRPGSTSDLFHPAITGLAPLTIEPFSISHSSGAAQHFRAVGNFTLLPNQSIWGWGSRMVKMEITGSAHFQSGSLVNVSAIGRLGGAGGGAGGVPAAPRPSVTYRDTRPTLPYNVGLGGTATSVATAGEAGQRAGAFLSGGTTPLDEQSYANALGGGTGQPGQGDQYLIGLTGTQSSTATGGTPVPFSGAVPGGAAGGQPAMIATVAGGGGQAGANGANGTAGANGRVESLAGVALHLRAGSGGGAGGHGGHGVGGGTGGSGGGGAFGNPTPFDLMPPTGGNGGVGGSGGAGGVGGVGGAGGGGGGAIQVVVWGAFNNQATWESRGGNGVAGVAGTAGSAGTGGVAGTNGVGSGGRGGAGGNGGSGGTGAAGGNGSGGAGGSIQIAASAYLNLGSYFTEGGNGAPAGLVQFHGFNGNVQNQPFGAFAAAANPWRSYVRSLFATVPRSPGLDPGSTPYIYLLEGGPAISGLMPRTASEQQFLRTATQSPADAVAVIARLDPVVLSLANTDYDAVIVASLTGAPFTITSPGFRAVSPVDTATQPAGFESVIPSVQLVGSSGSPFPADKWWVTYVEKNKAFEATGQFLSPLTGEVREFRGNITRNNLTTPYSNVVVLRDRGTPTFSLTTSAEYTDAEPLGRIANGQTRTIYRYVRNGSAVQADFGVASDPGSPVGSSFTGTVSTVIHRFGQLPLAGPSATYGPIGLTTLAATVRVTSDNAQRVSWVENPLLSAIFQPELDSNARQMRIDVWERVVSGVPRLSAAIRSGESFFIVQPVPGNSGSAAIPITNSNIGLPAAWAADLASRPNLTNLTILSARVEGPDAALFSVVEPLPKVIPLGQTASVAVQFTPPAVGDYRATLILTTDFIAAYGQPGQSVSIPLRGIGGGYYLWAQALPPGQREIDQDGNIDGLMNLVNYAFGDEPDLSPYLPRVSRLGASTSRITFSFPATGREDVRWSIQGSENLQDWQTLADRDTLGRWTLDPNLSFPDLTEAAEGNRRRVTFTHYFTPPRYFYRIAPKLVTAGQ